jgi:hypothetical protein
MLASLIFASRWIECLGRLGADPGKAHYPFRDNFIGLRLFADDPRNTAILRRRDANVRRKEMGEMTL